MDGSKPPSISPLDLYGAIGTAAAPEKENTDEGEGGERQHRPAFERAAADAVHRLEHDREHRRFQAEEERGYGRHTAASGIDVA